MESQVDEHRQVWGSFCGESERLLKREMQECQPVGKASDAECKVNKGLAL